MAIFNFQKPDKVIMIDSTDFEGKFELDFRTRIRIDRW
jgi:lipid A disaccharide synthetase